MSLPWKHNQTLLLRCFCGCLPRLGAVYGSSSEAGRPIVLSGNVTVMEIGRSEVAPGGSGPFLVARPWRRSQLC